MEVLQTLKFLWLSGDVDQLPPVGPGTVLSAAIESKAIPVVDLREIFRQARESNIVKAAHSVQQGTFPALHEISPHLLQASLHTYPDWVCVFLAEWNGAREYVFPSVPDISI